MTSPSLGRRQETGEPDPAVGPEPRTGTAPARGVARPEGDPELVEGGYRVRFARDEADLERVLRLRFEVFNVELREGLEGSWTTGLDEDRFDRACHHLMLLEERSGELAGTYRLQTAAMAADGPGFYCAQEFDLSRLPAPMLAESVELGRACIARDHRHGVALFALWRGLALYSRLRGTRYFFGCCSLSSQDPREGLGMWRRLDREGRVSRELSVVPRPGLACEGASDDELEVEMPKLFGTYLRYGSVACGPPAIDRDFKTIDFFIVLDVEALDPRLRALFFAGLPAPRELDRCGGRPA
jgi:putative hemolysin